jgi:CRP-like cAMP-binding protein
MASVALLSWPSVRRVSADLRVDEHDVEVLRRCPLLAPLTRVALEQLARKAMATVCGSGSRVIEQGEIGQTFFVIDTGALVAQIDGVTIRTMGPGDCFGEIAALNRTPRTATVVAREPSRLLRLDGADFVFAVTGHRSADRAARDLTRQRLDRRAPAVVEAEPDPTAP